MQTLTIEGELTIYNAAEQKVRLFAFLKSGDELTINFAALTEIDTAGLQFLILIKREAAKASKNLSYVMHSNPLTGNTGVDQAHRRFWRSGPVDRLTKGSDMSLAATRHGQIDHTRQRRSSASYRVPAC